MDMDHSVAAAVMSFVELQKINGPDYEEQWH